MTNRSDSAKKHGIWRYFNDLAVTGDEVRGQALATTEKSAARLPSSNGVRCYRELPGKGVRFIQDGGQRRTNLQEADLDSPGHALK